MGPLLFNYLIPVLNPRDRKICHNLIGRSLVGYARKEPESILSIVTLKTSVNSSGIKYGHKLKFITRDGQIRLSGLRAVFCGSRACSRTDRFSAYADHAFTIYHLPFTILPNLGKWTQRENIMDRYLCNNSTTFTLLVKIEQ